MAKAKLTTFFCRLQTRTNGGFDPVEAVTAEEAASAFVAANMDLATDHLSIEDLVDGAEVDVELHKHGSFAVRLAQRTSVVGVRSIVTAPVANPAHREG